MPTYQDVVISTIFCVSCSNKVKIIMPAKAYNDWKDGKRLQDVWPESTIDEREWLISALCPTCWNEMAQSQMDEE